MILQTTLQIADQIFGFPTGFDVVADLFEQWLLARDFVNRLKMV